MTSKAEEKVLQNGKLTEELEALRNQVTDLKKKKKKPD